MRKECMKTSTGVIRMASASKISAQTYGTKQHFILSELYSIFSKGYWKFLAKGMIYLSVTGSVREVLKNIFFSLSCYFPQKMNKKGWASWGLAVPSSDKLNLATHYPAAS